MSITDADFLLTPEEMEKRRALRELDQVFQRLANERLEPQAKQSALVGELETLAQQQGALEKRVENEQAGALYSLGPYATPEEASQQFQESEDRAVEAVDRVGRAIRRNGYLTAPFESDYARSRLVKGTGGKVVDEETGDLRQAGFFEAAGEALKRQRLAEADPIAEQKRQVREGEQPLEKYFVPGTDVEAPLTDAGIEEDFIDPTIGLLMAPEVVVGETVFGRQPVLTKGGKEQELLFFAVDREGNPYDPDSIPYKASQFLEDVAPDYMAQGRLLPFEGVPLPLQLPRPFQATERDQGLMAASRKGDYLMRVVDQVAERRSLGDEYFSLPLYRESMGEAHAAGEIGFGVLASKGETVLGMHPAYAAGTAASVFIPTPFNVVGKAVRGVGKAGSKAAGMLGTPAILERLQVQAAARKALGIDPTGLLDPMATPTLRTQAVRAATAPATTSLEMAAVAREALDNGGRLNVDDMAKRFGGDPVAEAMLDQARQASAPVVQTAGEIDSKVLGDVAEAYMRAPDYAEILRKLKSKEIDVAKAKDLLQGMLPPGVASRMDSFGQAEVERLLRGRLSIVGHTPNTTNTFINGMYAMGSELESMVRMGVEASGIATRAIKGLGTNGRLFQDNLMRSLLEEASGAGKDVARLIGAQARKAPSPARLKTMLDALGDGRGGVAVARAFRQTMETVARDRILQHLPDDFAFVSPRFMAKMDKVVETRRAMARAAKDVYRTEGTSSVDQLIVPVGATSIDDIIKMFVGEVGPGALGAGEGFGAARAIVRKLKKGDKLTPEEAGLFRDAMNDAFARRVTGLTEAVTEGAQTAIGRNLASVKNALYADAYSGEIVGRGGRAVKRGFAALSEVIPVAKMASEGNAAASIVVSPSVEKGITPAAINTFKTWYTELIQKPIVEKAFYGYKPESSVISETYARRIGDAVATAFERVNGRYAELVEEGLEGNPVVTRVVEEMNNEFSQLNVDRFARMMQGSLDAIAAERNVAVAALPKGVVVGEALRTARLMVSKVTAAKVEGSFETGMGVIDAALKTVGLPDGLKGLESLSQGDALGAVWMATQRALLEQKNADDWVSLLQTLMPGEAAFNMIVGGFGKAPPQLTLRQAVDALVASPGSSKVNIRNGLLLPDVDGAKAVLTLLAEKNGVDILDSTLQYSGLRSLFKKAQKANAWTQGVQAWLVHQRAGMDSTRIFNELVDAHPEQVLDMFPASPLAAKRLQEDAALSVVRKMQEIEERLTGKPSNARLYRDAYLEAQRFVATGSASSMGDKALSPLGQSIYKVLKFMETVDFALTAENRIQLASDMMSRSSSGRGTIPDMGSLAHKIISDFTGYKSQVIGQLDASQAKTLKTHVGQLIAKYEVNDPFFKHLQSVSPEIGNKVGGRDLVGNITDAVYLGFIDGVDQSMLTPTYRAFNDLWRRAGLQLDAGFIPSVDTSIVMPNIIRPHFGSPVTMAAANTIESAAKNLQTAVASGRLQARLEELSIKSKLVGTPAAAKIPYLTLIALKQVAQTGTRIARSTLLAGGGVLALGPNVLYHTGNVGSVPELLMGTLGGEMAVKAMSQIPAGLASAGRNASSIFFRNTVGRALAPMTDVNEVVIKHPFLGNITAGELDKMMDAANIKFSRASIEAYESVAEQMIQTAKLGLSANTTIAKAQQFGRMFDPRGMHEWMKFAEDTDGVTRRATFIAALVDGMSVEQAAMLARESLLDYGKVAATGSPASQFMQKWTMFWAFRRQSLIMTTNALADGKFGRRELMGRWIKLQAEQKKGVSPEEYLFGPSYAKLRAYWTPGTDEFGFNAGFPSVLTEGLGDLLGYMSTLGSAFNAVGAQFGPELQAKEARDNVYYQLIDLMSKENFGPGITVIAKSAQALGRDGDKGPLVEDVYMAKLLAFDRLTDMKATPAFISAFGLVEDTDPETGEPVVTKGRPYIQSDPALKGLMQKPHQFRFKTMAHYRYFLYTQALFTYIGHGRVQDEWMKFALTVEPLVPSGFKPQYRAAVGTLSYMMRLETPMRTEAPRQQRIKIQKLRERQIKQAGR